MLDLKMIKGDIDALQDPSSILLSESAAKIIFNNADPINKVIRVENIPAKVAGVYKDMPASSTFANQNFITSWAFKLNKSFKRNFFYGEIFFITT